MSARPLVQLRDVQKDYGGLRPLRIRELLLEKRERASILGLDAAAAEVLVNLITGASLPDAGEVKIFGTPTSAISDSADWLRLLDRIGIVSARAVLLNDLTVGQNMTVPFTLELDPPPQAIAESVVALAEETGLEAGLLDVKSAKATEEVRARVRLARAIALSPEVLLLEHASASVPSEAVERFAACVVRVAERRQLAVLALTADRRFADALGGRLLALHPATGELGPLTGWRRWIS